MSAKYKQYWERHGRRRPLPSLHDAVEMFGRDAVMYAAPRYEKPQRCPWCGGEVKSKRRRFCCDDCKTQFENLTVWGRGRGAYSMRILYRDGFTCQDCGEFHGFINEHGLAVPVDDGKLEVHHIRPVSEGGGDEPQNLVVLCKACHQERHKKMKLQGEATT